MGHLAMQSARDLAAGVLIGAPADAAHEHLDDCGACRERVAALLRADDTDGVSATSVAALGTPPTREPIELDPGAHDTTVANAPHARERARKPAAPQVDRLDEYKLIELLGRGGMGTVYRARDTLLERDVAIKLIARASSDIARQRFLVEARAVARIRHPNVVVVHRVGIAGDLPYIVYELVRGRTLDTLTRPMAWPKVVERAVGITRGLAAAHACGVLHRDLKPQNLMIDDNDDVVLVDFGLAKLDDDVTIATPAIDITAALAIETPVTVTGIALGTPRYMAPEAWRGLDPTPQTDVYSVGVVMYELLAGRSPFAETAIDALARRVCTEDPPPLADHAPWVPAALGALVDRCVARDPARRPVTAAAIGDELEAIQRGRAFETFVRDRVPRAPAGNPYKADQPFGIDDAAVLFGRGDELRAVVDAVRSRPLVVVTGDDGAGKTSLCRAGVLPIIRHGALGGARRWMPVSVVLGARPVAALADALAVHVEQPRDVVEAALRADPTDLVVKFRAGHRSGCAAHVVYIDALDDVLAAPPAEAAIFARALARLAEPSGGVRVIATARTRNLGAIAALPGLGTAIGPAVYFLAEPRDPAALREIVAEPAKLGGRPLAPPVVDDLVAAAARGELRLRELEIKLASLWDASRVPA